jgi:serine protease Do
MTNYNDNTYSHQNISIGRNELIPLDTRIYENRRNKKKNRRISIAVLVFCLFFSTAFGFAGGYISSGFQSAKLEDEMNAYMRSISASLLELSAAEAPSAGIPATPVAAEDTVRPLNVVEAAAFAKQSVVEITTEVASSYGRFGQFISNGAGSGVIISTDGYIVTNYHVINGARTIGVRLSDGTDCMAVVKGADQKTDLAVIKIEKTGLVPATMGDSAALKVGEPAIAIGNPLGELGGTVTSGIISALGREIIIDDESFSLLQTDTAINPGNSGGGLFNLSGILIGIVNAKSSGTEIEGLGFAIPINTAKPIINDLINHGYVRGRVDTGLTLVDVQNSRAAFMYNVSAVGLYVYKSVSSALQNGDRIISVDGAAVSDLPGFNAIVNAHKVGDTLQITVVRGGKNVAVSLVLTELKPTV